MATYKGHLEDASGNLLLPVSPDIAPVQTSTTASQSYAVGDFFYYNNTLYKVTSAISSGGTISVGSNCTATTVGAELKNGSSSGGLFIDTSGSYTAITAHNQSYTATEDCVAIGLIKYTTSGTTGRNAYLYLDAALVYKTSLAGQEVAVFLPMKKGQTIRSRDDTGQTAKSRYDISVWALLS